MGRMKLLGVIQSIGAFFTLGLAGCGASASLAGATPMTTRTTAPGSRTTFATWTEPTPTSTPATMPTPVITPAPSAGWATYRDSRFGFEVPIPPGWWPASCIWTSPSASDDYIVQFFSPGSHGQCGFGATSMEPQLIQIIVVTSGPYISFAQNSGFTPEPGMVALGGERVPLYDRGEPGYGSDILRAAETTLGTYPLMFEMQYLAEHEWDPAIAQRDISLYLAMMQGFRPASN